MTPYYQHGGITIYHGDCREILPGLQVEAVVTDPPYGIAFDRGRKRFRPGLDWKGGDGDRNWPDVIGDDAPFDPSPLVQFKEAIIWGAQNFSSDLPTSRGWLVWDKLGDKSPCDFGDCEIAWTSINMPVRIHRQLWRGIIREGEENVANGKKLHPCQKPLALMSWCLSFIKSPIVCDPYAGSGTTLRAAKDRAIQAIGIEIEERYCEIAAKRMEQEVFQWEESR